MKRISVFIVALVLLFSGINKVSASGEEYIIFINSDNSSRLCRADGDNFIPDNTGYSPIPEYDFYRQCSNPVTDQSIIDSVYSLNEVNSQQVLTLKSGIHYTNIVTNVYGELKITSNNELVYINMIYGAWAKLENLNSESFTSTSNYVIDKENDTRLYTHFHLGELEIKNSTIKLTNGTNNSQDVIHTVITPGFDDFGNITIDNSTVISSTIKVQDNKKINIKNHSNVYVPYIICEDSTSTTSEISIDESYVELLSNTLIVYRDTNGTLDDTNDDVYFPASSYVTSRNKISITSSEVITNGTIGTINLIIKNSSIYGYKDGYTNHHLGEINSINLSIENSEVKLKGNVVAYNTLNMKNAWLECENGSNSTIGTMSVEFYAESPIYDYSTLSPLTAGTISLTNSNFRAVSNGIVPAVAIFAGITSDNENFIFKNDDNDILELEEVDSSVFFNIPDGHTINLNQRDFGTLPKVYTPLKGTDTSSIVQTGESETITLKIINGTWEDGTTEDKTIKVVKGTVINKDFIETISSIENGNLVFTKTGENEYTYEYSTNTQEEITPEEKEVVENPKTGVPSLIVLLLITIIAMTILLLNKNKLTIFKNA